MSAPLKRNLQLFRLFHSSTKRGFREFLDEIDHQFEAKLSDSEVNSLFAANEFCMPISSSPVSHFSANQVPVNRPVEDRWNANCFGRASNRSFLSDSSVGGFLFNVTDGHAGQACAHAVNMRYQDYLVAGLLPYDDVTTAYNELKNNLMTAGLTESYLEKRNPWGILQNDVREQHVKQLRKYLEELVSTWEPETDVIDRREVLQASLVRLDLDMRTSALPASRATLNRVLLRMALSGCVSSMAYLPAGTDDLYVAQVGDCGAVLGSQDPNGDWSADLLVQPHNAQNAAELLRLRAEHPINEASYLIRDDRLLGELMPLRSFGDVRYKWSAEELKAVASHLDMAPNYPVTPSNYYTPPYLTATPEVVHRKLDRSRDRFLVLATDGLWDLLTPGEAVQVVAQHLAEKDVVDSDSPKELDTKKGHCNTPPCVCDSGENASSRLIKTALGGPNLDAIRISTMLSIPANVARYYRDDITVLVVFFTPTSS